MPRVVEFRILGPLEVLDAGRPLSLSGASRALLALLLLHANEVVSSDRLIDELWGAEPPAAGSTALRVRVSQLRKALGREDVLVTRAPGYFVRVGPGELDLHRFERLLEEAEGAEPPVAAERLRAALALWRGEPLGEFAYEPFARTAIARLEELRLVALERRIEADLTLGRHAELVGELQALVREHPLQERLRRQLMLALYRSGRQVDALEAYQEARRALVEELGIDPSPALRELEQAILRQDVSLDLAQTAAPERSILVWSRGGESLDPLLEIAEPLSRRPARELILTRVVGRDELAQATELLSARRDELASHRVPGRVAAFASTDAGRDVARLAAEQDVDLVLLDGGLEPDVESVLDGAPCDVALLLERREVSVGPDRPVLAPFGGAEHDWSAVEIAAWIARAREAPLRLVGSTGGPDGHDASRLLASVSLLIQRAVGIATSPLLVEPGEEGLVQAAADAGLIVFGLPAGWRREGLGRVRSGVARASSAPTLLVCKGLRPGGLAPAASQTSFTWSLGR